MDAMTALTRMVRTGQLLALTLALAAGSAAQAQPVTRIVVGGPPGGLFDIVIRIVSPQLERALGTTVVIDNKPGAGGSVALEHVKNAKPDGLTVATLNLAPAANETIIKKKGYDLLGDFEPVGMYLHPSNILIAHPSVTATSVKELVELVKARGSTNYSSGGIGSPGHLAGEMFKARTGVPVTHVPYKGAPPAVLAVVTGEVAYFFATASSAIGQVTAGKVRALAVTTAERLPQLPDVPTMAEAGFPDLNVSDWFGVVLPKGTPAGVRDKLHAALSAAIDDPAARERLRQATFVPAAKVLGPDEFGAFLRAEVDKWAKVVREAKIAQD
jgi:tripartite-type tricarboxylate transporter receptor subunit TctC